MPALSQTSRYVGFGGPQARKWNLGGDAVGRELPPSRPQQAPSAMQPRAAVPGAQAAYAAQDTARQAQWDRNIAAQRGQSAEVYGAEQDRIAREIAARRAAPMQMGGGGQPAQFGIGQFERDQMARAMQQPAPAQQQQAQWSAMQPQQAGGGDGGAAQREFLARYLAARR